MAQSLEVRDLSKAYGGVQARARRVVHARRRRAGRAHRAERRRQDHLLQPAERPARPGCGRDPGSAEASLAGLPPHRICAPRRRPHVPDHADLRLDERARERAGRASFAPPWVRIAPFGCAEAPSRRSAASCSSASAWRSQAERPCAVLAYGDLKRVELAMALASRPRVLLMDEPTAGMAPEERGALMQLAAEARAQRQDRRALHRARHGRGVRLRGARHRAASAAK